MRAVFISYRREDAEGHAGRLFKDLTAQFGKDAVFMDVVAIEPGRDFRRVIDQQVASCGVLLAMIGKGWLDAKNKKGLRRLDDATDFVRLETASALKRDIPVIPVLVHGGTMPRAEDLPDDLKDLAYRNAVELTHARWDSDVQLLVEALRPYVGRPEHEPGSANPTRPAEATAAKLVTGGKVPMSNAPELRDVVPTTVTAPAKKPSRAIMATLALIIAVAVGGYLSYERFSAEKAEAERLRAEAAMAKSEVAAVKAVADKATAERAAAEKATAERAAAEKAAAERVAAGKATAERVAAGKATAERVAAEKAAAEKATVEKVATPKASNVRVAAKKTDPHVEFETTAGKIRVELYPDAAPKTVANFLDYVKAKHYDGTQFHRVISGFMIQGGGYTADFQKKPTKPPVPIEAEQSSKAGLLNVPGTLSMARTSDPNSATSQFFINVNDNRALNFKSADARGYGYTVFGKVVAGMDVVDKIAKTPTGAGGPFSTDVPAERVVINKAVVIDAK